jgi:hypothetical protein
LENVFRWRTTPALRWRPSFIDTRCLMISPIYLQAAFQVSAGWLGRAISPTPAP